MAFDLSVRKMLNQRNIDNSRIGYNVNTGTVTVDNKDFMRPQKNYGGTTFTDQPSFDQAYSSYFPNQQSPVTPTQQAPQTSQNIIGDIYNRVMNPTPYDVYASPEYSAAQAQSQRTAQQGVRAAQEALGASGFGRSTNLAERAQGIQNQANEYLLTQIVPQLIAQNQARQQQQISNIGSLINPLMQGEQFAQTFPLQVAQTTGQYMPPEARNIIDNILELKRQAEMPGVAGQQLQGLKSQADLLRDQLEGMGINPSFIGSDINRNTATQNRASAGVPTLEARQFTEGQRQFNVTAERDAKQFAERMGLDWATLKQNEKEFVRSLAIQQQNANTASGGLELRRSEQDSQQQQAQSSQMDPKESANNYYSAIGELTNAIKSNATKDEAIQYANALQGSLTSQDYRNLLKYIDDNFYEN